ncbi:MAG: segregation/condensation protein A [Deltaproteobacteria bacterium]|nr:segregation/condensation protein A [Deltaproteobacteria bacterium]
MKLHAFEGPLDLLLHLIRANEVDIADIPIAAISEQYLAYLELMRSLDIDVAADYLLMAATLAHIKSRMLLPPDPDILGEDEGEDPRAELARRLAEYAVFKDAADALARRQLLNRDVFAAEPDASTLPEKEGVLAVSLFALIEAMQGVLGRVSPAAQHHIVSRERITLQQSMIEVMDRLRVSAGATLRFEELFPSGLEASRERIVLAFLSILELAKIQALLIFQNATGDGRPDGPIRVRLAVGDAPDEAEIEAAAAEAEAEFSTRVDLEEVPETAATDEPETDEGGDAW